MAAIDAYRCTVYVTAWVWMGWAVKIRAVNKDMNGMEGFDDLENSDNCLRIVKARK